MITEQQIQELYPDLIRQALSFTHNMDDALDLAQEVMCKLWLQRETEVDYLRGYAYFVCKNVFIDKVHRDRRFKRDIRQLTRIDNLVENILLYEPSSADSCILCDELKEIINELPEKSRDTHEDWMDGYKYRELAERYQEPEGTIKSRISRSKKYIAKKLEVA